MPPPAQPDFSPPPAGQAPAYLPPSYGQAPSYPPPAGQAPSYPPPAGQTPAYLPPSYGQAPSYPPPAGPPSYPPSYGQAPSYPPPSYGQAPSYPPPAGPQQGRQSGSAARWLIGLGLAMILGAGGFAIYEATKTSGGGSTSGGGVATTTPRPTAPPTEVQAQAPTPAAPSDDPTPADSIAKPLPERPTGTIEPALPAGAGELIYLSSDYELLSVPASGGAASELDLGAGFSFIFISGKWSPDGTTIASYETEGEGAKFLLANSDGSATRPAGTLADATPDELVWAPDSSKVAFVASDFDFDDTSDQNIYIIDVASGELRQVTEGGGVSTYMLAWAPDSAALAYTSSGEGQSLPALHVIGADGQGQRTLVEETFIHALHWLPDGRLAYDGECAGGFSDICGIDPAGGTPELLASLESQSFSGHSPDGEWVMLDNYEDQSLSILNLATGATETVAPPGADTFYLWSEWSPDSAYVTYYTIDPSITYVYSVGSNEPARPLLDGQLLEWLP